MALERKGYLANVAKGGYHSTRRTMRLVERGGELFTIRYSTDGAVVRTLGELAPDAHGVLRLVR